MLKDVMCKILEDLSRSCKNFYMGKYY